MAADGNMRDVYLECARQAEAIAAERDRRDGPFYAEIVPGVRPRWHVIATYPQHEATAAKFLSARRFAIYQPEIERGWRYGGYTVERAVEPMFPGNLLAFVWDIERHAARIEACPGVSHVLRCAEGHAAELSDAIVDAIVAQECSRLLKKRRRRVSRTGRDIDVANPDIPEGMVRISTKAYLGNLASLDSGQRIDALHSTLGLSS